MKNINFKKKEVAILPTVVFKQSVTGWISSFYTKAIFSIQGRIELSHIYKTKSIC